MHATLVPVAIVAAVRLPAAPTILTDAVEADAVTQQGASGPLLPVLSVAGVDEAVDEAVAFIGRREKPLCVYVYYPPRNRPTSIPQIRNMDNL